MHEFSDFDDSQLLRLLQESDESVFAELYNRYSLSLYRYAASRVHQPEDAEEIIQEIFITLWEKREHLEHVKNLRAYLYSSVRHKIANHINHSTVRDTYAKNFLLFEATSDNGTYEQSDLADLQQLIERSLSALSPNCQKVFKLSRLENYSISEIATEMNLSTGTVENYITQALKHLRRKL